MREWEGARSAPAVARRSRDRRVGRDMAAAAHAQGRTLKLGADTHPDLPAAGRVTAIASEGALQCVQPDVSRGEGASRPETPPEIKKYRKSSQNQPGAINKHWGAADDSVPLPASGAYGRKNVRSEGVESVIAPYPQSELMRWRLERQEDLYHSSKLEPLGRSMNRGHVLPPEMGDSVPFGRPVGAVEKAKAGEALALIFPAEGQYEVAPEADSASIEHKQYVRTHGDYHPGEQKRRNYDWAAAGIDPAEYTFGGVAKVKAVHGVAKALNPQIEGSASATIVSKRIEDFKLADADELGRCKTLGCGGAAGQGHTFGIPSRRNDDEWGVGQLIAGDYSLEEQMPDVNLGKSLRRGFRNVEADEDRSFGVPTIRTDIPAPGNKSVADNRNYGNEPNASNLLYRGENPNVAEEDYLQVLDRKAMRALFDASGIAVAGFDAVFDAAAQADGLVGGASVDTMRKQLLS